MDVALAEARARDDGGEAGAVGARAFGEEVAVVAEVHEHRGRRQEVEPVAEIVAAAGAVGAGEERDEAVRFERRLEGREELVGGGCAGDCRRRGG